jgi:hypothetical protein
LGRANAKLQGCMPPALHVGAASRPEHAQRTPAGAPGFPLTSSRAAAAAGAVPVTSVFSCLFPASEAVRSQPTERPSTHSYASSLHCCQHRPPASLAVSVRRRTSHVRPAESVEQRRRRLLLGPLRPRGFRSCCELRCLSSRPSRRGSQPGSGSPGPRLGPFVWLNSAHSHRWGPAPALASTG